MPHANKASDSHEIRPLTGIRGFAAMAVVLFHFFPAWVSMLPGLRPAATAASHGGLGVDLFFILSGFILSYVYNAGEARFGSVQYRRFLWFRLARVFPNHVATLAVLMAMIAVATHFGIALTGDYPLSGLPFQLTMTHAWPYIPGGMWNYPSWTISAEWFAYLCVFPVSWYMLRRRLSTAWSIAVGYGFLAIWLFGFSDPWFINYQALLQVSCEFIAGSMFFGAFRWADPVTGACQRYASLILAVILALLAFAPDDISIAMKVVVLLFPMLLLGVTAETSMVSRMFSTAPVLWLGRVSYALYMSHAVTLKVIKIILPAERYVNAPLVIRLMVLCSNLVLILFVAAVLYYIVEIPARNFMRKVSISRSDRKARPTPGTARANK